MKNITVKVLLIIFGILLFLALNPGKVYGATFSISSSTATVEPGGSFSIIIKTNGAGYVNLTCINGSLSENYVWVEGTKNITCKAANSGSKVIINASGVIADFNTGNDENKSGSTSVQIKEKIIEQNTSKTPTNTQSNQNSIKKEEKNKSKSTNKKITNTNKTQTIKKQEENQNIVVSNEDQGTEEELLIEDMNVFTIDKDGNKENIQLVPVFDGKITYYTLNVDNNIDKLEFDSKYNKEYELKIEGADEKLKVGENVIKITLTRNEESKVYKFLVMKEEEKKVEEQIEIKEKTNSNDLKFSIPEFIGIIIGCVLIENIIVLSLYKIIKAKKRENY